MMSSKIWYIYSFLSFWCSFTDQIFDQILIKYWLFSYQFHGNYFLGNSIYMHKLLWNFIFMKLSELLDTFYEIIFPDLTNCIFIAFVRNKYGNFVKKIYNIWALFIEYNIWGLKMIIWWNGIVPYPCFIYRGTNI